MRKTILNVLAGLTLSLTAFGPIAYATTKPKAKPAAAKPKAATGTKRTPAKTKPAAKPAKPKPKPFKLNLDSYGAYIVDEKKLIGHKDVNKVLTLSSVSKVFVTQWALATRGLEFRYTVKVYTTQRTNMPGVYNVHLSSDNHPYLDSKVFAKITEYLKSKNVTNIETLSYDEGFRFLVDADNKCARMCDHALSYPSNDAVKANLRAVNHRGLKIGLIKYWPSRSKDPRGFTPAKTTKVAAFYSEKMVDLLHDMNSHSNNHAANQIFNSLGGASAYASHAAKLYKLSRGEHVMYNGSGNPIFIDDKKYYNTGTSSNVIQALAFIYAYMKPFGGVSHVLALAAPSESNTLGAYTRVPILQDRLVAKTGTTWDSITLAGVLSTKRGPMVFYFNIDINSKNSSQNKVDASNSKQEIRAYLTGMMNALGQGPKFE